MSFTSSETQIFAKNARLTKLVYLIKPSIAGLLLPLSFAPFHFPGLAFLGLAILFSALQNKSYKKSIAIGLAFGLSFMSFGVSWVFVSINLYGNLNIYLSTLVTIFFVLYLSIFYIIQAILFNYLSRNVTQVFSAFLFSASWCLCEFMRANFASGFSWLLVGFGQVDSPLKYLLPYIGVYGVSFLTALAGSFLCLSMQHKTWKNLPYLITFLLIILTPISLKNIKHISIPRDPINVGIIQANLSMRDKWDDVVFDKILSRYLDGINNLKEKAKLIVLPESSIPVPQIYVYDFLNEVKRINKASGTQVLIGIPEELNSDGTLYYNTLTSFGNGHKTYLKQHLVPFGEYIPKPFNKITEYLGIPDAAMIKGPSKQPLLTYKKLPFASLICFEVAYPQILRAQLPKAEWIVSVSDAGWFGKSFAIYQLLQMSQALSIMTDRYQIVANNNGLSSIIDNKGQIVNSLQAFSSMDLSGQIQPITSKTIWVMIGDNLYLYICLIIIILGFFRKYLTKRYF